MNDIHVGDLVETCDMIPGFVVAINPSDPDEIEVQAFNKYLQYIPGYGACHSICNCGVHKISTKRAMLLTAIGHDRLSEMWNDYLAGKFDWYDDSVFEKELENLRNSK